MLFVTFDTSAMHAKCSKNAQVCRKCCKLCILYTANNIIFTLLYSLTIEQFLMQLYLGCTLMSNLIHSLMLSNMFSAGGGAIYDAPKARGGAIFDAHKPRGGAIFVASKPRGGAIFVASKPQGGAIFVAYHWNVLIKNANFQK